MKRYRHHFFNLPAGVVRLYWWPLRMIDLGLEGLKRGAQRALRIPVRPGLEAEDWGYRLARVTLEQAPERIRELVEQISDEAITHAKGEKLEYVQETESGEYLPLRGGILQAKLYYARIVDFVERSLGKPRLEGARILDVGASSSLLFELLGKKGVGLNVSEGALASMRDRGIEVVSGSSDALPFEDGSFDAVFCFNTLAHVDNPVGTALELARVSRGPVFVSMGDAPEFKFRDYSPDDLGRHRWTKFRWTREAFESLADYAGLEVKSREEILGFPPPSGWKNRLYQARWGRGRRYVIYALEKRD